MTADTSTRKRRSPGQIEREARALDQIAKALEEGAAFSVGGLSDLVSEIHALVKATGR